VRKLLSRLSVHAYVALFFLVLAIVFYFLIPYQIDKPKMVFGRNLMDMKPTLFPAIAALCLAAMCVLSIINSYIEPEENPFKDMNWSSFRKIAGLVGILYVFALMFEPIGFLISGIIIVGFTSFYLGNRSPIMIAILAFGVPSTVYFVFIKLLKISLPEGLLY
jgi:putative tricarboxylic transport membrane protein